MFFLRYGQNQYNYPTALFTEKHNRDEVYCYHRFYSEVGVKCFEIIPDRYPTFLDISNGVQDKNSWLSRNASKPLVNLGASKLSTSIGITQQMYNQFTLGMSGCLTIWTEVCPTTLALFFRLKYLALCAEFNHKRAKTRSNSIFFSMLNITFFSFEYETLKPKFTSDCTEFY